MKEIKQELKELKEEGKKNVILNGWEEHLEYVQSLSNLRRIDKGIYETID